MKIFILLLLMAVIVAVFGTSVPAAFALEAKDCSFLLNQLGKDVLETHVIEDMSDLDISLEMHHPTSKAWHDSDMAWRFKVLHDFEIGDLVAAPGHRFLRKPQQIEGLVKYIQENNGGSFIHDKLVFNIITDKDHNIASVDIWNAHHRAVAYLKAGYKTIGQLDPNNLEILVDGYDIHQTMWPHFLPAAGVDIDEFHDFGIVPQYSEDIRVGTISVNGGSSNFSLGSRGSIRQLYYNMLEHRQPKVGIYFGAFDPVHEGHIATARKAMKEFGLDEVVFVPNVHAVNKPGVTDFHLRVDMLAARLKNEKGLNYYKNDSSTIIDRFGRDPFVERIGQIYGTKQLYQIAGSDSIEKLLSEGKITPQSNRTYLAFGRKGQPVTDSIPEHLKLIVLTSKSDDDAGLSSTEIREAFKSGHVPPVEKLNPEVASVIIKNQLYK